MILSEKSINRLCIYFFYDKDGVVDDYVIYMLKDMKSNCQEVMCVCNGILSPEGREKLEQVVDKVLVRENKGFDVWAYKKALEFYGWKELSKYDEVVLMNFTMFGPLYPFNEMFEVMNKRDLDFWGITKHHGYSFDPFGTIPYGYIPEHIQSSFIVVRNKMLQSPEFMNYWDNMDEVKSYGEAVGKHEAIFTKTFSEYGFKNDVYVQTDDLKEYTHYPLMITSKELIENRRCPVFKRKAFTNEYYEFLNASLGEPTIEMYDYIKKNFEYDLNMVWDNLLRIENMSDIKNRMHLNFVLPKEYVLDRGNVDNKYKVALVYHLYYEDKIDDSISYISMMPDSADIIITIVNEELKELIECKIKKLSQNVKIVVIENRGRDVSALLVGAAPYIFNYDLVCFAHDKKTTQMKPYTVGQSFEYKCFENILGSKEYVENIIGTFLKNERLGMLMPPPPNHGGFFGILGNEWANNYDNVVDLAKSLKINVNLDCDKEPIAPLGTMFWFRPEALRGLYEKKWVYGDFPEEPNNYDGTLLHAIERIYGYAAQSRGYYVGWCLTDKFASIEITNLHFMLREMTIGLYNKGIYAWNFDMMLYLLKQFQGEASGKKKTFKYSFKQAIYKITPRFIWNIEKNIYRKLGGTKMIHENLQY